MKRRITVVAAVIEKDGLIFCAKRKSGGETGLKWEFPGGKINFDESPVEALKREIREEFLAEIKVLSLIDIIQYEYNTFHIDLHAYYCQLVNDDLTLTEHLESKWIQRDELNDIDFAPADRLLFDKLKN